MATEAVAVGPVRWHTWYDLISNAYLHRATVEVGTEMFGIHLRNKSELVTDDERIGAEVALHLKVMDVYKVCSDQGADV